MWKPNGAASAVPTHQTPHLEELPNRQQRTLSLAQLQFLDQLARRHDHRPRPGARIRTSPQRCFSRITTGAALTVDSPLSPANTISEYRAFNGFSAAAITA